MTPPAVFRRPKSCACAFGRVAVAAALVAGLGANGCMSGQQLAARIGQSLSPEVVPEAVGCWEREFEAAGFKGEYMAVVDFTLDSSGQLGDVKVQAIEPTARAGAPATEEPTTSLSACLERALGRANLASSGWTPDGSVSVAGFRIALTDASAEARKAAAEAAANMLIGPRADHCLGLYSHHPPLDAARLMNELRTARAAAEAVPPDKRDELARALQKVYDLALELHKRLALDAATADDAHLTEEGLLESEHVAEKVGAQLGCTDLPWTTR